MAGYDGRGAGGGAVGPEARVTASRASGPTLRSHGGSCGEDSTQHGSGTAPGLKCWSHVSGLKTKQVQGSVQREIS